MSKISDLEKVRMLIPHWIEHNRSHAEEFGKWSGQARTAGAPDVADLVARAAELLQQAEAALGAALEKAGGPLAAPDHHHHHEHS